MPQKRDNEKRAFFPSRIPEILITAGIILMAVNALHFTLRDRALSVQTQALAAYEAVEPVRAAEPTHISIAWRVDTPVATGVIRDGKWTVNETEATFLASSARPGEQGNSIFYGHNKREILGNIRVLQPGEKIKITTSDGVDHWYVVEKTQQVAPDNLEWLQPTDTEVITLYTCAGLLDRERFLVRAVPLEEPVEDTANPS